MAGLIIKMVDRRSPGGTLTQYRRTSMENTGQMVVAIVVALRKDDPPKSRLQFF
jgi:hypothetical protein